MFRFIKDNWVIFLSGSILYGLGKVMIFKGLMYYVHMSKMFEIFLLVCIYIPSRLLGEVIGMLIASIVSLFSRSISDLQFEAIVNVVSSGVEFMTAQIIILTACVSFFFFVRGMKKNFILTKKTKS